MNIEGRDLQYFDRGDVSFLAPTVSRCINYVGGQAARDNDGVSIVSTRSENFVYYFLTYHRL